MSRSAALLASLLALAFVAGGCHGSNHRSGSTVVEPQAAAERNTAVAIVLRSSHGAFGFFPKSVGAASCVIPGGGPAPGLRIRGRCSTKVSFESGRYSGRPVVVLTESWPWRSFHRVGSPFREQHHRWHFVVLPSRKVLALGQNGDFPPQNVK